jgi:hypothetical protein
MPCHNLHEHQIISFFKDKSLVMQIMASAQYKAISCVFGMAEV